MLRMIAALLCLVSLACTKDNILQAVEDKDVPTGVSTTDTLPSTYGPQLGVNFTWASDQLIDGDPAVAASRYQHVRYFQMMEKDYSNGTPANTLLEPCTDLDNPWSCAETSMRQHLVRVKKLRAMFPQGIVWIAPEVLNNRSWPCKGWTVDELGGDPEEAGYQWAKVAFATYAQVPGVVVAMTNEEWCAEAGRANAYNEWRRGVIRAHRENPSCALAIGARHVREREWNGKRMPDNVLDVSSDIWTYVNSVGGWADFHAHGIENGRFLPHAQAHQAEDYRDFFAWSAWLDTNYPNIKKSVGEIAYTTSEPGVVATAAEKRADWPTYSRLVKQLAGEADVVFLYQIQDHSRPEGAFSGSGVYPELNAEVEALAREVRAGEN